jgi:hypothetical protein
MALSEFSAGYIFPNTWVSRQIACRNTGIWPFRRQECNSNEIPQAANRVVDVFAPSTGKNMRNLLKPLRLVILMSSGAFAGFIIHSLLPSPVCELRNAPLTGNELINERLQALSLTLFGAFTGLAVEIHLRSGQLTQKISWQFRLRDLFVIVAIAATVFWIIAMLFQRIPTIT